MKRISVLLAGLLLAAAASFAQDSMLTPPEAAGEAAHDEASPVVLPRDPEDGSVIDPSVASAEWAAAKFADFKKDDSMCDDGTALYEDALRNEALRNHPEWPIWAIDIALEDARNSYLRAMLFPR